MRYIAVGVLLLGVTACTSSSPTPVSPTTSVGAATGTSSAPAATQPGTLGIRLLPSSSVTVGDIGHVLAYLVPPTGSTTEVTSSTTWTTSDSAIATITTVDVPYPTVQFAGLGRVEIRATYQQAVAILPVFVIPISSVTVTGLDDSQYVGVTAPVGATFTRSDGSTGTRSTTFFSSNDAIGTDDWVLGGVRS